MAERVRPQWIRPVILAPAPLPTVHPPGMSELFKNPYEFIGVLTIILKNTTNS